MERTHQIQISCKTCNSVRVPRQKVNLALPFYRILSISYTILHNHDKQTRVHKMVSRNKTCLKFLSATFSTFFRYFHNDKKDNSCFWTKHWHTYVNTDVFGVLLQICYYRCGWSVPHICYYRCVITDVLLQMCYYSPRGGVILIEYNVVL